MDRKRSFDLVEAENPSLVENWESNSVQDLCDNNGEIEEFKNLWCPDSGAIKKKTLELRQFVPFKQCKDIIDQSDPEDLTPVLQKAQEVNLHVEKVIFSKVTICNYLRI
jgi:hypothetical protein